MAALAGLGVLGAAYFLTKGSSKEEVTVKSTGPTIVNSSMDIFIRYLQQAKKAAKEGT